MIHGGHLKLGDHLWSVPPRVRPMLTLVADTLEHPPHPFGARSHDLLYCRCDSRMYEIVYGRTGVRNCNDNLAEAIAEFGIGSEHVHDPFNIFMTTGLNDEGIDARRVAEEFRDRLETMRAGRSFINGADAPIPK